MRKTKFAITLAIVARCIDLVSSSRCSLFSIIIVFPPKITVENAKIKYKVFYQLIQRGAWQSHRQCLNLL